MTEIHLILKYVVLSRLIRCKIQRKTLLLCLHVTTQNVSFSVTLTC